MAKQPADSAPAERPRGAPPQQRVTIRQIADASGLSIATVSHVLGSRADSYSQATREKVQGAALALGYRPNSVARAMRSGRSNVIALLLSSNSGRSYLPGPLLDAVIDTLDEHDLHLSIGRMPEALLSNPAAMPKLLREWLADGLILNYQYQIPEALKDQIDRHHIPAVWINAPLDHDNIRPDESGAVAKLVAELTRRGHQRIAYGDLWHDMSAQGNHFSVAARYEGYRAAVIAAGLQPSVFGGDHRSRSDFGRAAERHLLAVDLLRSLPAGQRPTAIVCYSQSTAYAIHTAALELGIKVPAELSLVTIADEVPSMTGLPITSMLTPWAGIGRAAVEAVRTRCADPATHLPVQHLRMILAEGASVAPAPAQG